MATAFLAMAVMFVTMVVGIIAAMLVTKRTPDNPAALQWIEIAGYAAAAAYLLRRLPRIACRTLAELGLRRPSRAAWKTFAVALAAIVALSATQSAIMGLLRVHHVQHGFEGFFPDIVRHIRGGSIEAVLTLAMTVALVAVVAPFTEELFFRGFLFRALAVRAPWTIAALLSSLLFGLVHGDAVLLAFFVAFGCVNAWAYRRTGNLVVAMVSHGTFNLASLLVGLAGAALASVTK
ncbi:MAG: lysostaphin resistance A-like protein [Candidatus Velthaea sp.]